MQVRPRAKVIGLSILIAGVAAFIIGAQLDPITVRVERVIDGDTIQVRFEGKSYTVRLLGVDTPETKHPTKVVQYFGREASAFTNPDYARDLNPSEIWVQKKGRSPLI